MRKIVVTGAAGLVGQNVIARLKERADVAVTGIDKHPTNTALLARLHPEVEVIEADLAVEGGWDAAFAGADAVLISQAQIGGLEASAFMANNVTATENIIASIRRHRVPYFVLVSSSVVNSRAEDDYVRTKREQENIVQSAADVPHAVLRPTLMFGWFDRKHLGWIARFMKRTPVFPVPGDGNFVRQPLYVGDFAAVILSAIGHRTTGTFDITGREQITYGALVRLIRESTGSRALIVNLPVPVFWWMLHVYGRISANPPFTTRQLEALIIPETFPVTDWPEVFGVTPTPLAAAISQTFHDPRFADVVLDF